MVKGSVGWAAALLAAAVCAVALSTIPLPSSLVSVDGARGLAHGDDAQAHMVYRRAKEDAVQAERDERLAASDSSTRKSVLKAAAGEERLLESQGRAMSALEGREERVLKAMRGLREGVAEAKGDEARSAWMMHQHFLATSQILGEVRSLTAQKAAQGKQEVRIDESMEGTDGKLGQSLARLHAGEKVLQSGRLAEVRIADKAQQAASEGRYEDSVDRVLEERSKALQRSAVVLQKRGGGQRETKGIQLLAAREMGLEKEAGQTALAVARLRSKARQAQGYVGVLERDMRAAEARVEQQAGRVEGLYRRAKQDRVAALVAAQRKRALGSEVQRGMRAVMANEEAFRRNEARMKGDQEAVSEVEPRLQKTAQVAHAMAEQVGRDIAREEKEGVAYVDDVREARLLQRSQSLHQMAGQVMGRASAVHGENAEGLLDEGKSYLDLSRVDLEDAKDSKSIRQLEKTRQW